MITNTDVFNANSYKDDSPTGYSSVVDEVQKQTDTLLATQEAEKKMAIEKEKQAEAAKIALAKKMKEEAVKAIKDKEAKVLADKIAAKKAEELKI